MPRTNDSRSRMIAAAAVLLAERGPAATGLREAAGLAAVSRGSLSHHFPAGKTEMVAEALRYAGARASALMQRAAAAQSPVELLDAVVAFYRDALLTSQFRRGCPVGAVAAADHDDPAARAAAAEVLATWEHLVATSLRRSGRRSQHADALAVTLIAGIEGAILMCRAHGSIDPLDQVSAQLRRLLHTSRAIATEHQAGPS
jgi:AcrR family transcriptional regulator